MTGPRLLAVLALAALPLGCGYHAGSLISPDIRSVHVQMFDSQDFRHEIEVPLTEAVKNEIARRTHLKVVNANAADTVLSGSITRVEAAVTAYDSSDQLFSQNVTVHVRFEWRRRQSNEVLCRVSDLSSTSQLLTLRGETQGTATREAFRDLAELIVERMQEDF